MSEVTVSPKYQIVIPRKIRESMKIRPGQKLPGVRLRSEEVRRAVHLAGPVNEFLPSSRCRRIDEIQTGPRS
jgi:AbrB family looped-hinge helix DNA binding protein